MGVLLMPQLLDLIFKQSAIIITGSEQPAEQMMNEANETIFNNWKNFIYTEAERIVDEGLRERERYDSLKSKDWGNQICEQIIAKLVNTNHHFKYMVNCIILASKSNGMEVTGCCYYDAEVDGMVTVKWESKAMVCIVNVYGCAV